MRTAASVRVAIKLRPSEAGKKVVTVDPQTSQVIVQLPSDEVQRVQADVVHDGGSCEQSIYQTGRLRQLMGKFIEGYNIAVLTYGHTGSGKTFALQGDKTHPGIIHQSIVQIFSQRSASTILKCSFIQLYNERLTDMLSPETAGDRGLRMRWQAEREFVIQDLTERECSSGEEMVREWEVGNRNRVVASNKIHEYSSRSHSIFVVGMEDTDPEGNQRVRQAHFVDLAGSERVFSPVGRLSKEAIQINKSLFFLRKVILSLEEMNSSSKEQYIPYRDSKLTSILKRSFGGNCLTYLIACINPTEDYLDETLSTLQYAVSARKIHNQVNINIDIKAREIRQLRDEKAKLKQELEAAMMQIQAFRSLEREEEVRRLANSEYANRIIECIGTVRELLKSNKALRAELEQERLEKNRLAQDLERAEKNAKTAKRTPYLEPIQQVLEKKNSRLKTEVPAEEEAKDRAAYSQSVELMRRKDKGSSVVRRKRFIMHESSPRR